jgi:tetratricopeptide (TPR) repeat protein
MHRLRTMTLLLALVAAVPGLARADQTDKTLDALFAELKATTDAGRGNALTRRIWQIWLEPRGDKATALLAKGVEEMSEEDYDAALKDFDKLVVLAPDFAEGWNRRATLRYLMDDLDGSVRDIERTLALEPRHFGALSGLGLIYMQLGKDAAALKAFRRALEIDPYLADVKANIKKLEQALGGRAL